MSQPSKHRRLDSATQSRRADRHHHQTGEFTFYRSIVERDDPQERTRTPWEMSWEHIHQFFVAPVLHAKRSEALLVTGSEAIEARRLYGHLIITVSALATAVVRDERSLFQVAQIHSRADLLVLLQLLDELHEHTFSTETFRDDYDTYAPDAFTSVLRLCLAVESQWQPHGAEARSGRDVDATNWVNRFRLDGTRHLARTAPDAITGTLRGLQDGHGKANDVVRYWCLAIVKWSQADPVRHKAQCRVVLQRLARTFEGFERATVAGLNVGLYVAAALASVEGCADENKQGHSCDLNARHEHEWNVVPCLFQLLQMQPTAPVCADCLERTVDKLHSGVLESDYDAAVCLFLIANQLGSITSRPSIASAVFNKVVSSLIASSNEEPEPNLEMARVLALGMDSLLHGRLESVLLRDEFAGPRTGESLRSVVKALVRLLLPETSESQQYTTKTTVILDVESLLYNDPRTSPVAACARVLIIYLEMALRESIASVDGCKASTHLQRSVLDCTTETDCISLNDVVNICLVLMESKDQHLVVGVVSEFLCRMWQRDDPAGHAILMQRPDLLSNTAVVVKRLHDKCAAGRILAKDMSESWLALCTSPDVDFRSWICYVFVRQEAALNVLVSLCHDRETSYAALQALLTLSEEASNLRLLARQPGLVGTLIRLVRDGAVTIQEPGLARDTDPLRLLDRDFIKERILVLAEVL